MIGAFGTALASAVGQLSDGLTTAVGGTVGVFLHVYPLGVAGIFILWRVVRRLLGGGGA